MPDQTGPQGYDFPQVEAPTFNLSAPRVGGVFALTEDQKTLVKASYGVYWDSPGFTLANLGNPNPNNNFTRYEWINPCRSTTPRGFPSTKAPTSSAG